MSATSQRVLQIAKPMLGEQEAEAARRVILSGWVTQGPEVAAFEREFASYVGATHAVAVSNCTTALHLALLAVGVAPGDEVITVSHSFIATANAIAYCGAVPVFVDIERDTFNVNPDQIEAAITSKTKALLCVHQLGMPCNLEAISAIARRHALPLVEDAACAIGSEILWNGAWEKIGRPHADIACFSFHPRKLVTTGDGGMLTTANAEYDRKFRLWRQHSMSVPDTVRHGAREVIFEEYPEIGFNYRMTDLQAAIGRVQLTRLPAILEHRRRLACEYAALLKRIDGVDAPHEPSWTRTNWQSYCVRLDERYDQREIMQRLLELGIAARRGVMNAHLERPYREGTAARVSLPVSENAQKQGIMMPLHYELTLEDVQRTCEALQTALKQ